MKYSINGTGNIVAERDIYSLGGFIPKGTVGGKIASESQLSQLSQDGECWLAGGDISGRPDIVIKDNAYVGTFTPGANPVHTDGVTEFSGNTLIPGNISVRSFVADTKNNVFIKDSFIGASMDVLCGPESTTTAFPFGQGTYNNGAAKGTLFENMAVTPTPVNICRSFADLRLGKDTYLYIPTGYNCRVLWAYYDTSDRLAYSGESIAFAAGLHKLSHPVYKVARMHIAKINGTAMTPADLLATGAKILGHISDRLLMDIRPESASGQYVMDKSSLLMNTDDFGLVAKQLRFMAGGMYDTNMYSNTNTSEYKLYGTFRNVERLEYTRYIPDSYRTAATRDTFISAYDCPLLRVDTYTLDTSLTGTGDLVLRRCIVPKGNFAHDPINGNTYEDLDFSYANEDLGFAMTGYSVFNSSHREGLYRVKSGTGTLGFVSHKGNLDATARLLRADVYLPLDGDLVESGGYLNSLGTDYRDAKLAASNRVRMARPLATFGAVFPSMPTGYAVLSIVYLDSSFIITRLVSNPTSISTDDPYFLLVFVKGDGNNPLPVNEFIALNRTLTMEDYTKVPEITGSAYVGAGCTVRGDVQLHGDPYVNRVFDINVWERGTMQDGDLPNYPTWSDRKIPTGAGNRFRFVDAFEVEPGGTFSCAEGYLIHLYRFDRSGKWIGQAGWATSQYIPKGETRFAGLIIKKATSASEPGGLIEDSDIPLANVKYVRAFKKRRYIVNELDRTSPEDILLGPDYWEQGYVDHVVGSTYEALKSASVNYIRLRLPVNTGMGATATQAAGYGRIAISLDSLTKCVSNDAAIIDGTPLCGAVIRKDPISPITPAEVPSSRFKIEFTPSPRIVTPYGSSTLFISGSKIRMYDNAVLSRNLNQEGEIVLQGDAVMGYDFNSGSCMCSNGHSDAITKLP